MTEENFSSVSRCKRFFTWRKSTGRHNAGSAVIEFAIIAPVLFLILTSTVEVGLMFYASSVLEGATNIGSRIGKTGYAPKGRTPQQYILSRIQQLSAGLLNKKQIVLKTTHYPDFESIGHGPGIPGTGGPGDVVIYTVSYNWKLFSPLMRMMFHVMPGHGGGSGHGHAQHEYYEGHSQQNSGTVKISAMATIRNEDFPPGGGGMGGVVLGGGATGTAATGAVPFQ